MEQIFRFRLRKTVLILFVLLGTVGCDQITKSVVRESLEASQSYLGGVVRLEHAENTGAFLSFGGQWPEPFRILVFQISVIGTLLLTAWLLWSRRGTILSTLGLSLVLAGGVGNLIDRLWKGSVTDFMLLDLGPLHTGIFNVADVAIVLGLCLAMIQTWGTRPKTGPSLS